MSGGSFMGIPGTHLRIVPTTQWGGLTLTLIIALIGIIVSMPLGILLALGRQSKLPIIKWFCVAFIELWRAVPLITVLFMASVMFPLFMPQGVNPDNLLRAIIGICLFQSAYMAEVVRGGLQAMPRGQFEASAALGLSKIKTMGLIILPQALKHVIPGIVNNFITLFKDTSLVSIIGVFELLNTVRSAARDVNWASPTQAVTGYIFAGFIFWIFCFGMSRYSLYMEDRLHTGHKR
jgi:general L-amino acid transport system permease protein